MNAEQTFLVDPHNPGEVFACCGLAMLHSRDSADARSGFQAGASVQDDTPTHRRVPPNNLTFTCTPGISLPERLIEAAESGAPDADWDRPWRMNPHRQLKTWAGHVKPKAILAGLLREARTALDAGMIEPWTAFYRPRQSAGFSVDPTGNWDRGELGWSINEHSHARDPRPLHRPLLELLAFLGLSEFALRSDRDGRLTYCLWHPSTYLVARCAFRGHGPHALAEFAVRSAKSGSYTNLDRSEFIRWKNTA